MNRLPLRLRIALVFTAVLAPVLALTGAYLYHRFGSDLDGAIDAGLRTRAADVRALVKASGPGLREVRLRARNEGFAEIVDAGGAIVDATRALDGRVLLTAAERQRALRSPIFLQRYGAPGLPSESRLLALPVDVDGSRAIVVVGTSTDVRADSLSDLLGVFAIGGPIALLLTALAAYGGAGAALRPVEAMRVRAAAISEAAPDERLPVPPSRDELARLGATLNAMLDRLGEALAHERRFVADASHELRTPLAILKTELELALGHGRTSQELRAALASAEEETDRLVQLSEDLLLLAQTDRGVLPIKRGAVEVREMLDDVAARFAVRARERAREITVSGARGVFAELDRLRLEQAVGNLLDNSLRYGAGTVELSFDESDADGLRISVADHGAGFPEDFVARAFERFSRSGEPGAGAGLGMSIVEAIVSAHGGTASVCNRDGGGAVVELRLRRALSGAARVSAVIATDTSRAARPT